MTSPGRARWAIGSLLAGGIVVNFFDRTVLSVASTPLAEEFGLSLGELGVVLAAFSWSYCLVQLPSGLLVDRIGVKWLNRIAVPLWAMASLLTAVASGLGLIVLARVLLGVAEGPSMVGASKATAAWFPTVERSRATALFDGATKLANVLAFPTLAWVISSWGWRAGFLFTTALSLLFAVVWWRGYRDPDEHPRLHGPERAYIRGGGARDAPHGTPGPLRGVLGSRRIWAMSLGFACYGYTINVVLTWMPVFFQRQFGAALGQAGLYAMVPWLVATAAELVVGGWLVDRMVRGGRDAVAGRRPVLLGGLALGATIGCAGWATSPLGAVLWMSLSLGGLAVAAPVAWSLPGLLAPPGAVGVVGGLMNFANTAATTGGVVLTGWLAEITGSFGAPFVFAVVVLAIGGLLYWPALRTDRAPASRTAEIRKALD
ncbi:MFS transporter [Streptantibioticus ferralitis]|uniref:MFS transporter n=1 Tax=Streptantibioticus ferralitis TaxID=236510 RepID=A0ABT5ZBW4_9ACTN|nr:MFS transporter [Streptantibioticus ferralitis]MDF2261279.1 MFS transporter [Streptantibioticus ferralitis]